MASLFHSLCFAMLIGMYTWSCLECGLDGKGVDVFNTRGGEKGKYFNVYAVDEVEMSSDVQVNC